MKYYFETMIDVITRNAADEKCVTFIGKNYEKTICYNDIYKRALRVLYNLQQNGFTPGNRVIIQIDNNEDFIYSIWACILGGMTIVPLSTDVTPENVRLLTSIIDILEEPRLIISKQIFKDLRTSLNKSFLPMLKKMEHKHAFWEDIMDSPVLSDKIYNADKNEIAAIMFSSGSTGAPKGVPQTHDNIINAIYGAVALHGITNKDTFLGWLPLTHIIGIHLFHFVPLSVGSNQIIMDKSYFVQNPVKWLETAHKYKATFLVSPNFGFKHFLQFFKKGQAKDWDLSHIRLILNGAEPVSETIANEFTHTLSEFGLNKNAMCPSYGMTEATITISSFIASNGISSIKIDRESLAVGSEIVETDEQPAPSFVSLGCTVNNLEVKICDDNSQTLKENFVGHICIRGTGVANGYYNNEIATKNAFTTDGWFRTGDIGFIKGKELYITGRSKDMVIINGQNYYLNDIDRIIQNVKGIANAAACPIRMYDTLKEEILLAVKFKGDLKSFLSLIPELQGSLNTQLGLTCKYIVPVDEIPCTSSGKVQRFKIVQIYEKGEFDAVISKIKSCKAKDTDNEETRLSEIESKLINIWSLVLNIKSIKRDDNFFRLGGNSIGIMQMMQLIENELNCQVSYNQFIINNTIAALADYINKNKNESDLYTIERKNQELENLYEPFPLTNIQMAYVLGRNESVELGGVGTHHYEEIRTNLNVERFNNAIQKLIKRHPSLRTIIFENGTQKIMKDIPDYKIQVDDLSQLSSWEIEERIIAERQRMSHYVFKPGMWPFFEFKAFKLTDKDYYLFISIDLLIFDAASLFYFSRELVKYYNNPDLILPDLNFTFRDYVIHLNEITKSDLYKKSRNYWLNKLETFPQAPNIPLIANPSNVTKPHFKRKRKIFGINEWLKLKTLAQEKNVTPSSILCTAYAQVLSFWSNQKDVALNLTVFSRYPFHEDVGSILGDFTSLIILGLEISPELTFWDKVEYVQKSTMEALENRHYDGVEFTREYARFNNIKSRAALPYVFSSILFDGGSEGLCELGSSKMQLSQTSQVYLDNQLMDSEGQLYITWDYVEQLFDPELIDTMFNQYINLISEIILYNDYDAAKLSDKYEMTYQLYNLSVKEFESDTLHGLFMQQARKNESNTAIIEGDESITYDQLNRKSNQMALYLLMQGIGKKNFVGVIAERKINTIINILGIIKSGAAYVPIDPSYPEERKEYIISNSNCTLILHPDSYEQNNVREYNENDICIYYPDEIAYVIYTSGSTGKPKGVIITHNGAVNTILDINNKFNVCESDRIIGISSMCFDLSVYDIFGALSTGAALIMVPDQRDVFNLINVVHEKKITIWNTVPAIMDMMLEYANNQTQSESLRLVMLSGDWIPLTLPEKISNNFPNAQIISLGGATEASIWSIYFPVKGIKSSWKSIPYGYPLTKQQLYILNFNRQLCPVGVPGEIYIGGKGVALGYLNDEIRTKESFIQHPQFGYLYKTGDFGVLHDGYIEFLGRKDNQVKIQGYRIEIDEIQNRLIKHPSVKNSIVTVFTDKKNEKHLCAYVVSDREIQNHEFRSFLSKDLPLYMIPTYFIKVDKIPLTPNGKLDGKSLPPLDKAQVKATEFVMPRNDIEKRIYECWKNTLGTDKISINDRFFEIGGDSVKAIQLVNLLSKTFNIKVNQVFESQTIAELAKHVTFKDDNIKEKISNLKSKQVQINKLKITEICSSKYKKYLSNINKFLNIDLSCDWGYQNVLLTGATGYLGTYILKELLQNTKYNIYVTVRGCTVESAIERFIKSVDGYLGEGFFANYKSRIFIILADLTKPYLNMSEETYNYYAGIINCIINCAANVKHFGLYEDFEEVNVHGVERLIEFANKGLKKDIHYISTNGLSMYNTQDPSNALYTEDDIDIGQEYDNFYLQTKFEAEKILVRARESGLNANIYRIGVLVFDSNNGKFQRNITENAFYNNLKSYIELGMVPDTTFEKLEFSYVDYVSKAIILLFDKVNLKNQVFHVFNNEKITLTEFAECLNHSLTDLKIKPFNDFIDTLASMQENDEKRPYFEDLLFTYSIFEGISYVPEIRNDKTNAVLSRLGFSWKKPDEKLLNKMIEHCKKVNFIYAKEIIS
ncbi:non-ribosomal peptide synthetase [Pseudobacteroides cellulosolvens]|uniref:Amino acid adenylation domain protein n=1 Tax=Pseudobacteroides cellulosolvens ATCC 35603 = DSM 2933 TaxID=398512 RepID=A0A0L6JQS9_9FIRM|nr:non-ribosomal peptide synthetase [Pseudobacteroides cellulosolvens]KNY28148.1 amino acid adenylation domain protein [Pseudobacteroides cellulosolvens ATCC 35603 = DSM 2933]